MRGLDKLKFYKNINKDDFRILDLWKLKNSSVVFFAEEIQKEFNIVINYMSGNIIKFDAENSPHHSEVILRFVLNNEIVDAERIYYDDKQFFVRMVGEQRIRRISLKTIKEVQFNGQVFNLENYKF